MDRIAALSLLNLPGSATDAEINAAYWSQRVDLERRMRQAFGDEEFPGIERQLDLLAVAWRTLTRELPSTGFNQQEDTVTETSTSAEPNAEPPDSQVLLGRYRLKEPIGSGPFGDFYDAFDFTRNEPVLVEVLYPGLLARADHRDAFLLEAQALLFLDHPNILRIFGILEDSAGHFLVMEHALGQTLRAALSNPSAQRSYTIPQVRRIGIELCEGLHYAHRYVTHQAVLPESIFITQDGRAKLMDFGFRRLTGVAANLNAPGSSLIGGIAPEQRLDPATDPDPRSDQYAVGLVLYELLAAERPEGPIPPLRDVRPDVPKLLAEAIERALRSKPAERFADARALGKALSRRWRAPSLGEIRAMYEQHDQRAPADRDLGGRAPRSRKLPVAQAGIVLVALVLGALLYVGSWWDPVSLSSPEDAGGPEQFERSASSEAIQPRPSGESDAADSSGHQSPPPSESLGEAPSTPVEAVAPLEPRTPLSSAPTSGDDEPQTSTTETAPPADAAPRMDSSRPAGDASSTFGSPKSHLHARAAALEARSAALATWRHLERATRDDTGLAISDRAEVWRMLTESQQFFAESRFEQARESWLAAARAAKELVARAQSSGFSQSTDVGGDE